MKYATEINDYIAGFPDNVQLLLEQLRTSIQIAAPDAEESISYKMPVFKMNGIVVYFAAYKNHIGFYPTAEGIAAFETELSGYKWSKGAIQFPLDQPLPLELVTRIVKYKVNSNLHRFEKKRNKRP